MIKTSKSMKKLLIAMSGGVDSSVAAYLMKEQGYSCIGATLKLFHNDDIGAARERTCCSLEDVEDARSVAHKLEIPYYVFNFSEHFREKVIDKFVRLYENGMTPNPCIDCNRYLKFGKLLLRAKELHCDFVVTGHYARIEYDATFGRYLLKKALHPDKDQSYALYAMTQDQLAHTLFPLGGLTKQEVRQVAQRHGFVNAGKQDSQDICFVQNRRYADFIEQYTGHSYPEGDFVDARGNILGAHKGIIRYTLGQRKGLGVSAAEPLYVCDINPESNAVTLGTNAKLYSKVLTAKNINLIAASRIDKPVRLKAKTRYRQPAQWAVVTQTDHDTLVVEFEKPQRAITKGQAVVLYDGDIVVGGGTIQ
ncbi:tRNA 2-thiouridine(34) synthase MnmA [Christensenellaceae bacterium OttesenSCG-928-M15]|nr:tRNA 2-thiouridine(34) synthase MnmA [Christensenellaceae bacterium OttesenSCG-928-M15]